MKAALFVLALVCSPALGAEPISVSYHERIGIPEATRIQQAEAGAGAGARHGAGGRIAGGQAAPLGAHPYLAGLLIRLTVGVNSVCGATLLSHTKLVTAAHCWWDGRYQGEEVTAVLGSTTLFSGGVRVTSRAVDSHASFNPTNLNNDIAIITIPFVQYTNVISSIALPTGFLSWLTFEYNIGVVAGFGVTRDSEEITLNQSLRHVRAMVVNNLDCASVYGWNVIHSTICTSGQGLVGPCGGDSGGPLVVTLSGEEYLIGVTSFHSYNGCNIGFPGGYARVTSFLAWIQARL